MYPIPNMKKGFSLIELLVVIAIIAIILGLAMPNYLGARQRGRDAKRKEELGQMKNALRLYYNDYARYPSDATGTTVNGCGTDGKQACPGSGACAAVAFAAGSGTGCDTVYMKQFPTEFTQTGSTMRYYQLSSGDDFLLKVPLENASDPDAGTSRLRCPGSGGTTCAVGDYCVCAD